MEQPLVVTDAADDVIDLIEEAGELAAATGVPLRVLTVVTRSEYENDADTLESIEQVEGSRYGIGPQEYAETVANSAITDLLADVDIETEAIGKVVEDEAAKADTILEVARTHGCDYIFMMGSERSPAGKAIFGDTAQSVILNFDHYVVTYSA